MCFVKVCTKNTRSLNIFSGVFRRSLEVSHINSEPIRRVFKTFLKVFQTETQWRRICRESEEDDDGEEADGEERNSHVEFKLNWEKWEVINERYFIIVTSEGCFANGKETEQSRPWNVLHRMKTTAWYAILTADWNRHHLLIKFLLIFITSLINSKIQDHKSTVEHRSWDTAQTVLNMLRELA